MAGSTTVVRGKGRPRLDQTAGIDSAIREAAMAVLVEQGEAATVQAVAQAAGLTRKTLYARYSSREQLFSAVIRDLLRNIKPLQYNRQDSAVACVRAYIEAMLGALVRPDALAVQRLLAADLKRDAELKADLMAASRIMLFDPLALLLEQGVADGEFVIPDVLWAAGAILRLVVSEVISSCEFEEFLDNAEVRAAKAARIAALVLDGLLARPG